MTLTRKIGLNPFFYNEREISNIIFYDNENTYPVGRGWFGYNNHCKSLEIDEIKLRRTVDLNRKENFVIIDKDYKDYNNLPCYKLYLYIDNNHIKFSYKNKIDKDSQGLSEYHYKIYDIEISGEQFKHEYLDHIDKTDKCKIIEEKWEELKNNGINISHKDMVVLWEKYNLTEKNA